MMSSSLKHLASLIQEFDLIIPKKAKESEEVRHLFAFDVDTFPESCETIFGFQEEFIDIQCDSLLRNALKKENLCQFWTKIKNEKSVFDTPAVKAQLLFFTTCLCECGFSALAPIKTKTGNCLEPDDDVRLALSKIVLNFDKVVKTIQNQGSH